MSTTCVGSCSRRRLARAQQVDENRPDDDVADHDRVDLRPEPRRLGEFAGTPPQEPKVRCDAVVRVRHALGGPIAQQVANEDRQECLERRLGEDGATLLHRPGEVLLDVAARSDRGTTLDLR